MNRRTGSGTDAVLELLDRQIVDPDGRMVGKVDDVELEERADGRVVVTGLLTGPGALGPRFGAALGSITTSTWSRLSGREHPFRVDFTDVTELGTVVRIAVSRRDLHVDGFEEWMRDNVVVAIPGSGESRPAGREPGPKPEDRDTAGRHRLTRLVGMRIRFADDRDGDRVIDVRMRAGDRTRGRLPELVTDGLLVGKARPGTLFGYDRHPSQGPWLLRVLVRWLHRHTGYVAWHDIEHIDWEHRTVRLRTRSLRALTPARDTSVQ